MNDGESTDELLRGFIRRVLAMREDRSAITDDIRDELKEARSCGFDSRKITEVCIWIEKVDKHGRDAMVMAESLFDLYREVAEGPAAPVAEIFEAARDKALAEMFAAPPAEEPKVNKRVKAAHKAADLAKAAKRARGGQ